MTTVTCSSCGKTLEKVPHWLAGTTIQFVCNNCPNRTVKAITQVTLEPVKGPESDEMGAIAATVGEDDDLDED